MTNKLLFTTFLSLALWANSFAQCTYTSSANVNANTVKNCTSISISGLGTTVTVTNDWNPLSLTSIVISDGAVLDFNGKTVTMPVGSTLTLNGSSTISTGGNANSSLVIGGKTYLSTDFGGINNGGGANQLGPLPVELISFHGEAGATGNSLHWETAEETDFSHFDIERSVNGQTFTKISQVKAKGSNSEYGFLDENPDHNTYYRLKINDIDGAFSYSEVISLQVSRPRVVEIYPTITQDAVTIVAAETENIAPVTVFDMFGKAVIVVNSLDNNRLDLSALNAGMYLVQWQIGSQIQSAKVIKK